METNLLLMVLVCLVLVLLILVLYQTIKINQNRDLNIVKAQLDDQYQNDKTLMLKSQETATSLLSLQQQFQTLLSEFHLLNKGNYYSTNLITDMAKNISEMQAVMINKKTRGNWGEYQLESLLSLYIGNNKNIYERQYQLKNGVLGDVALHLPNSDKVLILDAKFPLENYRNLIDAKGQKQLEDKYLQLFKTNIKKHIRDISHKYITEETLDLAIMFIPSEAIYSFICAKADELIDEAYQAHVLITSPTTLAGVVFTLLNATKEFHRSQHIKEIEKDLQALLDDVRRLVERTNKANQYAHLTVKQMDEMAISIDKLASRIQKISDGQDEQNLV